MWRVMGDRWTTDLLVFAVLIFLIFLVARYVIHVSWPFAVVSSWSMLPTLRVGDFVILTGVQTCSQIHVGDIVVYIASLPFPPGEWIIHRVIAVDPGCQITTKGDNMLTNPISDQAYGEPPVTLNNLVGEVVVTIPYIGVFPLLVRPQSSAGVGLWLVRFIFFAILVGAYYVVFGRYR